MSIVQIRILLHVVRKNLLATAGQLALFAFLAGAMWLIISATAFNLEHKTGFGGTWFDVVVGVVIGLAALLSAITVVFNNLDRAKRVLRPFAEQKQGFIVPLERFPERLRREANLRAGVDVDQPVLF